MPFENLRVVSIIEPVLDPPNATYWRADLPAPPATAGYAVTCRIRRHVGEIWAVPIRNEVSIDLSGVKLDFFQDAVAALSGDGQIPGLQ